jgi:hypothetical protein
MVKHGKRSTSVVVPRELRTASYSNIHGLLPRIQLHVELRLRSAPRAQHRRLNLTNPLALASDIPRRSIIDVLAIAHLLQ